jgi:hypothetical protein
MDLTNVHHRKPNYTNVPSNNYIEPELYFTHTHTRTHAHTHSLSLSQHTLPRVNLKHIPPPSHDLVTFPNFRSVVKFAENCLGTVQVSWSASCCQLLPQAEVTQPATTGQVRCCKNRIRPCRAGRPSSPTPPPPLSFR